MQLLTVLIVTFGLQVPVAHGKADLTIYREAGAEVSSMYGSYPYRDRIWVVLLLSIYCPT